MQFFFFFFFFELLVIGYLQAKTITVTPPAKIVHLTILQLNYQPDLRELMHF
jgi:hypothetical protein